MENCAFGLEDVTARKAGYNFGYIVFYVIKHCLTLKLLDHIHIEA